MTNADKPARRRDVAGVARTLKGRIDRFEVRLSAKIDEADKRLERKIDEVDKRLERKIDGVAVRLVNVEADVRQLKEQVSKLPTREELLTKLDGWAARFEATDRSREIRRDQLRDHEQRITALERRA